MRVWAYTILLLLMTSLASFGGSLSGLVQKESYIQDKSNQIIDSTTGVPIGNAVVSIPSKGLSVVTDPNGYFEMDANINNPVILSVKAKGYRPFSLTATKETFGKPFTLGISKQKINEIVIDATLHHLGDNNFSSNSANAGDFKTESVGPRFTKKFFVKNIKSGQQTYIKIGSIIGVDTEMAKKLRQNSIRFSSSSPTKVFVNSKQIGEIKINGDDQTISFASDILNQNADNEVMIETGRNMQKYSSIDYDDIEIMNLMLEIK